MTEIQQEGDCNKNTAHWVVGIFGTPLCWAGGFSFEVKGIWGASVPCYVGVVLCMAVLAYTEYNRRKNLPAADNSPQEPNVDKVSDQDPLPTTPLSINN